MIPWLVTEVTGRYASLINAMIRLAKLEDAYQIAETQVASWKTTYAGQIPQAYLNELSVPKREAIWSQVLTDTNQRVLVAEKSGEIVGFSNFGPCRDSDQLSGVGELYAIYLIEKFKRRGIGHELWSQTSDLMLKLGYREVTLWVLNTNKQACNFYEKLGFKLDSTQKQDKIGGQTVVELRYRLRLGQHKKLTN